MSGGIQDDLHAFAATLLERCGGLVEWPAHAESGTAVVPPEVAAALELEEEMIGLSTEAGGGGLCVSLATDFLEVAGRLLQGEPRVGLFRVPELYLKRGDMDDAVRRAFTWLNAKVKVGQARPTQVGYHTWWFHASLVSEDRWETRFPITINASSRAEVCIPDPLTLWELEPREGLGPQMPLTYDRAVSRARSRVKVLAAEFIGRMDSRLQRDRKRLREYYGALFREAKNKKARGNVQPDPGKLEARKRAVRLELRRKLSELDERYAMEAVLRPLILIRTEIPALALDLAVFRKRSQRKHTAYWNPLLKRFEPLCCSRCGAESFSLAFTNEDVEPLCPTCAR